MKANAIKILPDGTQEIVEIELPDDYFDDPVIPEPPSEDIDAKIDARINALWDELASAYAEGVNSI